MTSNFTARVSFGHCDPAGIVHYPNTFCWMDATFHDFLRPFGGHAALCAALGATGIGLVDVGATFRRPMRDGDLVTIRLSVESWSKRSVSLAYTAVVEDWCVFEGREVRALFQQTAEGMRATEVAQLRAMLEERDDG
ncbi:acyl-CoA thioesterase [Yoonia sp. R2-816]|uniref:acyl-CoA thioesterase n=1 Tax=Yoonia sp. R2-816 TaxID=3342638 RepID=UPI00372AA283